MASPMPNALVTERRWSDHRRGLVTRCPNRRRNQRFCSFVGCGVIFFRRRRGIRGGHSSRTPSRHCVTVRDDLVMYSFSFFAGVATLLVLAGIALQRARYCARITCVGGWRVLEAVAGRCGGVRACCGFLFAGIHARDSSRASVAGEARGRAGHRPGRWSIRSRRRWSRGGCSMGSCASSAGAAAGARGGR